jgi:hypothetical protein
VSLHKPWGYAPEGQAHGLPHRTGSARR